MTNNTKPSQWAYRVWEEASNASFVAPAGPYAAEAAALIIEQARKEWEAEVAEWLREDDTWKEVVSLTCVMRNSDTARACHKIATMIENGSHRKDKP